MSDSTPFKLDRAWVRRSFEGAAGTYAAAATLQSAVRHELLARLEFFPLRPAVIVDLGAGPGDGATALRARYPRAHVIAADLAPAMLLAARRQQRFWRRYSLLCADAESMPLASHSVDLVFSNLCLQWCDDLRAALGEICRVLRPGGLLLASSFGPQTLHELQSAWAAADDLPHVSLFPDLPLLATELGRAGFTEPVLDTDLQVRHYADAMQLQQELRAIGARNAQSGRRRGLTGKTRWKTMTAHYETLRDRSGLPASYEMVYIAAFAGVPNSSSVTSGTPGEQRIAVNTLRRRTVAR